MKLSEAMRLGRMLRPRASVDFETFDETCDLAAALEAIGELREEDCLPTQVRLVVSFPLLRSTMIQGEDFPPLPYYRGRGEMHIIKVITTLNDNNFWTTNQVADWVEQMEQKYAPEVFEPQEQEMVASHP